MCSSASIAKGTSKETFPYISGRNTSLTSNVLTTTTRTHTWMLCISLHQRMKMMLVHSTKLNRPHPPSSWHKQPAKAYQMTSNFELVATQRHTWKHTSPSLLRLRERPLDRSHPRELNCWTVRNPLCLLAMSNYLDFTSTVTEMSWWLAEFQLSNAKPQSLNFHPWSLLKVTMRKFLFNPPKQISIQNEWVAKYMQCSHALCFPQIPSSKKHKLPARKCFSLIHPSSVASELGITWMISAYSKASRSISTCSISLTKFPSAANCDLRKA